MHTSRPKGQTGRFCANKIKKGVCMNLIDVDINKLIPYANNPRKNARLFDDNNYDKAKYYLNLILREQQLQTFCVLKEIKNKNDS